jgi:hypothetical protein
MEISMEQFNFKVGDLIAFKQSGTHCLYYKSGNVYFQSGAYKSSDELCIIVKDNKEFKTMSIVWVKNLNGGVFDNECYLDYSRIQDEMELVK